MALVDSGCSALQWQATVLHIVADSACTQHWISDALTGRVQLTTKESEMLKWRWLTMITGTIKEYNLSGDVALVKSAVTRADALTCVPQRWLTAVQKVSKLLQLLCTASTLSIDLEWIMSIHEQSGHPGIKRILYFLKMVDPAVKKVDARMVVQSRKACLSIDPAPVPWQKGNLSATHVWNRLWIDVTHVGSQLYLTIISVVSPALPFGNCCIDRTLPA